MPTYRGSGGRPGSPLRPTTTRSPSASSRRRSSRRVSVCRPPSGATARSTGPTRSTTRLHDRGDGGAAGAGELGQRARGRQRRLPAPPPAGRSDAPLGPGRRRPPGTKPAVPRGPEPYAGPVPIVVHLRRDQHRESDGFTEAWYLPAARNLPAGFAPVGSFYDEFAAKFADQWGQVWEPGTAVFQYANDQRPATLWFHDHTLGMTRLNVYAGPAGFFLLRAVRRTCRPLSLDRPARGASRRRLLRDSDRHPGPLLHRGRRSGTRRAAPSSTASRVPTSPRAMCPDLEPGGLRRCDGGQRPHLAPAGGRAAPLPVAVPERLQ